MGKTFAGNTPILAAAISAILAAPEDALAQEQAEERGGLEEVVVTGTRIQREVGFTSPVPITAISNDELKSIAPGNTMAEALDKLPQFFQTVTAQRGGHPQFSGGRSSLDMRGMGASRTLVLIDGARTVPADISSRVNIDFIPSGLVERVDVVTGGASAAYGADALAGVTNFVLNRRFDGFRANVEAGQTGEGDGRNWRLNLAGGTELGENYHLTWAVDAQNIDQIQRESQFGYRRPDWMQSYGYVANPEWTPGAPASIPRQIVMPNVHGTGTAPTGVINFAFNRADPLAVTTTTVTDFPFTRHVFTADGQSTYQYPYGDAGCYRQSMPGGGIYYDPNSPTPQAACSTNTTSGGAMYDLQEAASSSGIFGQEVKVSNVFLGLERELEKGSIYGHLLYGYSYSGEKNHLRAPPLFNPWSATVHRDNAYLPQHIRDAMDDTGVTEFWLDVNGKIRAPGFENFNNDQTTINRWNTWSLALGFERELFDSGKWRLTGSFQRGETDKSGAMLRELRIDRAFLAMDAVEVYPDRRDVDGDGVIDLIADEDRGTGQIVCNVQRYNPTDEQLRLSVINVAEGGTSPYPTVRVPAAFGDVSQGESPESLIGIPGPVSMIDNSIRDCVPFNIMGTGHTSLQAANYLISDKWNVGAVTQDFAEFVLSGQITEGIGAGPFLFATGTSYRYESFWQHSEPWGLMAYGPPSNAPQIGIRGITSGWAGNRNVHRFADFGALKGEFDVTEAFVEFDFPLIDGARGRSLSTNIAGRYSDYSLSGGITSSKLGLDAGISESLRFRTTVSRDVREPTFSERWDVAGGGTTINDPFTGRLNFFTISNQVGNTALNPEKADTITAGFVYQPTAAEGLQLSLDWYEISLEDAVALLPYQTVVDTCYQTRDTSQTYCDFISRDPNTDLIAIINNRYVNVATAYVNGVDFEVAWRRPVNFLGMDESLDLRVLAGWLDENSQTPAGSTTKVERAGLSTYPDFKAVVTLGYSAGPFDVRLVGRYFPETILNMNQHINPMLACGAAACVPDTTAESQSVVNLTVGYEQEIANGLWNVSATVSNLFDTDPPVIPNAPGTGIAQTTPPARYDIYGRQFLVRFGYSF